MTIFCLSASHASAEVTLSKNVDNFEIETFTVASLNTKDGTVSYKNYDTSVTTAAKNAGITQLTTPASYSFDTEEKTFIENASTSRNIIGSDNRIRINNPQNTFPYKAICQIITYWDTDEDGEIDDTVGVATGFLEGPSIVVTNGHVVYDDYNNLWCEYAEVIPARDGANSQPFGIIESTTIHTSTAWIEEGDFDHDWAVIELELPIGKQTGWLGKMWTNGTLNGTSVNLTGYPGDKPDTMWCSPGHIVSTDSACVEHNCDTIKGSSGSPLYNSDHCAVAINSYSVDGGYNGAVRITEWLYNYLNSFNPAGPGSLDSVNSSRIAGWAWKPDAPNSSIQVHIYIRHANGDVITIYPVNAGNYRSDLESLGMGNGKHGYVYPINWSALPKENLTVEVYAVDGSGHHPRIYVGNYNNVN